MLRVLASTVSVNLQQKLLHREFWIQLVIGRLLPILIPLLAWQSIFEFSNAQSIQGWAEQEMVLYYFLVIIFSLFADIQFHIEMSQMVHMGTLNQWLIRPLNFFETMVSHILARIMLLLIPGFAVIMFGMYFVPGFSLLLSFRTIALGSILLTFSVLIFAILSSAIGMISFWTIRTESTFALIMLILEFFGGRLLPISLLPAWLQIISDFMPLRYAISLPVEALLHPSSVYLPSLFYGQIAWCILLCALTVLLWKYGIRRYDAVGN